MKILVNGRPHEVERRTLSYEDFHFLSGVIAHRPTVVYRLNVAGNVVGGELSPGDRLGISTGLVINVADTSNA